MNSDMIHFGTISIERYHGSLSGGSSRFPLERLEEAHAFRPHLSDHTICKVCERSESDHCFAYKIAEYLTALVAAYRTLSPVLERRSEFWWNLLTTPEKVLAYQILAATGVKVW
jgi:hypothetical protein